MRLAEEPIYILEPDGSKEKFNLAELQSRLFGCFVSAGRRESAHCAEDIALALDVSLRDIERPDSTFGRVEINMAIIRFLENAGFPEVAKLFARNDFTAVITISTSAKEDLARLLRSHIACSPERFDKIIDLIILAMRKLEISEASPNLLLELARHYDRELACSPCDAPEMTQVEFSSDDWLPLLDADGAELVDKGILRVGGVDTIFPSIRFYFVICDYARLKNWSTPATELEVEPDLLAAGKIIEAVRVVIDRAFGGKEPLPCTLAIPDMPDFLRDYFQLDIDDMEPKAKELAALLGAGIGDKLNKLSF